MRKWGMKLLLVALLFTLPGCGTVMDAVLTHVALPAVSDQRLAEPALLRNQTVENPELAQGDVLDALQSRLETIYESVNPAVVSIQVVKKVKTVNSRMPFYGQQVPETPYQQGAGSGFVWDQEGHIVTNNHVVEGADKITVRFHDGTSALATLVGTDPDSDLAVIKVDVSSDFLSPVQLGAFDQVKVGQLAVAIGNPFGLENTMTVGFVSALGRSLSTGNVPGASYSIPEIIQTDAPINPGNSGGVLVNAAGQVIGVPSAIISAVESSSGVGFAIPISIVRTVVPALIEDGHYAHAWLGISGTILVPEVATVMDLEADQRGVLVVEVVPEGPAEAAGLRGSQRSVKVDGRELPAGGDVIVAINSFELMDFEDLVAQLGRFTPGQEVTLDVLRDGEVVSLEVVLGTRPGDNVQDE